MVISRLVQGLQKVQWSEIWWNRSLQAQIRQLLNFCKRKKTFKPKVGLGRNWRYFDEKKYELSQYVNSTGLLVQDSEILMFNRIHSHDLLRISQKRSAQNYEIKRISRKWARNSWARKIVSLNFVCSKSSTLYVTFSR